MKKEKVSFAYTLSDSVRTQMQQEIILLRTMSNRIMEAREKLIEESKGYKTSDVEFMSLIQRSLGLADAYELLRREINKNVKYIEGEQIVPENYGS